jgi:hypothetical protein
LTFKALIIKNIVLMKTNFIKNKKVGFTISDFIFTILVLASMYGLYLYVPLVYKSQELEAIAKDYTFKTGGAKPDYIRAAVIEDAQKKLGIVLNAEDVTVTMDNERTKIEVKWTAIMELPFGLQIPRTFHLEYDRKQM